MTRATKMVLLTARFVKESYGHVKSYSAEAKNWKLKIYD
jgi:hypothetical protein